jgi:hypothetical protein
MKIKNILPAFSLGLIVLVASACSTAKLSTQTNDDVYFSDVTANEIVYTSVKNNTPVVRDYDENLNYYDEGIYNSRLNGFNNYSWRDYYYQNSGLAFDPFFGGGFNSFNNFNGGGFNSFNNFYGGNNFFNNGWSFNLGFGRPFGGFNNFYDPFFSPWNNFNSFYGNGAFGYGYGNIYSFYRPGAFNNGFGNYGFGNNYFFDPLTDNRPNSPRPRGSYDNNARSSGRSGGNGNNVPPSSRPVRPDGTGSSTPTRTVDATRNPSSGTTSVRPTRPTGTSSGTSSRPTQSTTPRPTREDRPTSSPTPSRSSDSGSSSSSDRSSSSGSSSSGGTSSPRPSRPGGN